MKESSFAIGIILLLSAIILPLTAQAEIYNCQGKWTNLPCADGKASQTIGESGGASRVMKPEVARAQSAKRSALHELSMKAIGAKRDFDLKFDLSQAEAICNSESRTLEECQTIISTLDDSLSTRIREAEIVSARKAEVAEKKRANEIAAEKNELLADRNAIAAARGRRNVIITHIEQNNFGTDDSTQIIGGLPHRPRPRSSPYPGRSPNSPTGRIINREPITRW